MHKPHNNKGIKRLINACKYSYDGLVAVYRSEEAFRQETLTAAIGFILSFFIADHFIEWILLVSALILLLVTELINSAIEAVIDRAEGDIHPLYKTAKDAGSAAVSLIIILNVLMWGGFIIF